MLQAYDARNADLRYWVNGVLRHRDEPGISPFDSVVQGGDAVWEGLRLYDGRIYGLDAHLARLRRSAHALGFAGIPADAEIVGGGPGDAAGQRHARRRARTAHADPRRQGDQRHGPPAEPGRLHPDRAGRAQAAGVRHRRAAADHRQRPPPRPGRARPEDPPQQPAQLDPGQDGGDTRPGPTTRSCSTAAASSPRPTRPTCSPSHDGRLATPRAVACPEGITRADRAAAGRDGRHPGRGARPHADRDSTPRTRSSAPAPWARSLP